MSRDRFARQNLFALPPDFHLASDYTRIVHYLSGTNMYAITQTHSEEKVGSRCMKPVRESMTGQILSLRGKVSCTRSLANMFGSLVRVPRRVN